MAEAGKGDKGSKKDKRKDAPREEGAEQAKLPASYIYWEEVVSYVIEVSEADYTEITVKDGEVESPLQGWAIAVLRIAFASTKRRVR